jgi:hypothetical protein
VVVRSFATFSDATVINDGVAQRRATVLLYRVIAQELATLGAAYGADEQRGPVARLADGSIRDRAAVSPAVARLLFQA